MTEHTPYTGDGTTLWDLGGSMVHVAPAGARESPWRGRWRTGFCAGGYRAGEAGAGDGAAAAGWMEIASAGAACDRRQGVDAAALARVIEMCSDDDPVPMACAYA